MDTTEDRPALLLLDRDTDVLEAARRCMRRGAELHVANTVDLAVRIAERRPVTIAVLDVTMAGMSPTDTVAKLRVHKPNLRIIFLAIASVSLNRRYGLIGPVLRKPVTPENDDGVRIEPDVSEPIANGTSPAATAEPGPLELPPLQ